MDTISRENNSMLPLAAIVVGVIAGILSTVALVKGTSTKNELAKLNEDTSARFNSVESQVSGASDKAESTRALVSRIQNDTNTAFSQVAEQLGTIRGEVTKLQESSRPAPKAAAGAKANAGPAVAGPDQYIVKKGDTPSKIARASGVSLEQFLQVNQGVNWTRLQPGQTLKLPKK